jgi:CheY-like chemotaxis protein
MGGLDATREIRRREESTGMHIRIVAMTAHTMNGDREQCLAAGMDDYLSKPVNRRLLYAMVEEDLSLLPPQESAGAKLDDTALMQRLGGDQQLLSEVAESFLEDWPARMASIESAARSGDADRVRSTARLLKGAAANLSAKALFEAAQALEQLAAEQRVNEFSTACHRLTREASHVVTELRRRSDAWRRANPAADTRSVA